MNVVMNSFASETRLHINNLNMAQKFKYFDNKISVNVDNFEIIFLKKTKNIF